MANRIREPFGKAGLIVAIVALVAAVGGTAFAAGVLTGKQRKEVEKIAKKFAGKPGEPGSSGDDGQNGVDGAAGTGVTTESFTGAVHGCNEGGIVVKSASPEVGVCNGRKGTIGTNGKSVAVGSEATGTANCNGNGGATVEVQGSSATRQYVCNGAKGATGGFGGQILSPGVTETGYWTFSTSGGTGAQAWATMSFPQPIADNVSVFNTAFSVDYVTDVSTDTICGAGEGGVGGSFLEPKAPEGYVCIFPRSGYPQNASYSKTQAFPNEFGDSVGASGAVMRFDLTTPANPAFGLGTWAVTGMQGF